jgi:putative ABC transport system ATP-binding protein
MSAGEGHGGGGLDGHGGHATPWQRLWGLLWLERAVVWVVVVLAVGIGVLSLATPLAVQVLINTVAFGAMLQPILVLAGLMVVCLGFVLGLRVLQQWAVELLQRRLWVRVSGDLAATLPRVRMDELSGRDGEGGAGLLNRFFDVLTLQKASSTLLVDGVSAALQAGVGLLLLAFYHPLLLAFDLLLIMCIGVIVMLGWGAQSTAIKESKHKYKLAGWLQEGARSPLAFRTAGGERLMRERSLELTAGYLEARSKHFWVLQRQFLGVFSTKLLANALLLGLGGWLVLEKQLTMGQLVAAELIVASVLAAFVKFGSKLETVYDLLAALDKLGHLQDLQLESHGRLVPESFQRGGPLEVSFEDVSFRYAEGEWVLKHVSGEIKAGERVALVGPSGSGKRTLMELLLGLHVPQEGCVRVSGFDVRDLDIRALRRVVGLAEAEGVLAGSIEENLRAGREGIEAEELRWVLKVSSLENVITKLPQGMQTILSATGAPLSKGQVARMLVARAMLGGPRLLLVDALLDGLDDENRGPLMDALFDPAAPWTLVVVTRDPQVQAKAERVWRLEAQGGENA